MSGANKPLFILMADRIETGLVVTFSNGSVVLFHSQFLWDVREADGNLPLTPARNDARP